MSGLKVKATAGLVLCAAICASAAANAQNTELQAQAPLSTSTPEAAPAPPPEKETWKAPFGGTFTATIAALNDYSYRGISQTQRQVAVQASAVYETRTFSEQLPLTAYAGFWGSNVNFPGTGAAAEIDINAGFRLKTFSDKLTFDLGYTRYNYPGTPDSLMYGNNEFSFVAGYDFGVAAVTGAVRYSPNFFANSGNAWYKWGQIAVPLPFLKVNENVAFKAFGTLGNQYVERFTNYGIPNNNYWDWQAGFVVSLYGFDFTAAYTGTNLSVQDCLGTQNCASRVIVGLSKTF
jgi:uncharacterized protein (TIGR02001 family)